jgi:hypothetical protein
MLNITLFPADSIDFFKKFVKNMKENRLDSDQKVKCGGGGGGFIRMLTF